MNTAPDEITKEQRTCAKAVNFGFIYGQREGGFIAVAKKNYGIEVSFDEAKAYRNAFFTSYPRIALWHEEVALSIKKTGAIRTINGWERRFHTETNKMICEKEKSLERKQSQIDSLEKRLLKEKELRATYQYRLQSAPHLQRSHSLLKKKEELVVELEARLKKLQYERNELVRRVKLAKSEENVVYVPRMLDEYRNILFSAYNLPIQGLGCELMAVALSKTYKILSNSSEKIINCVHDEIIIECLKENAEGVCKKLNDSMLSAFIEMFPLF